MNFRKNLSSLIFSLGVTLISTSAFAELDNSLNVTCIRHGWSHGYPGNPFINLEAHSAIITGEVDRNRVNFKPVEFRFRHNNNNEHESAVTRKVIVTPKLLNTYEVLNAKFEINDLKEYERQANWLDTDRSLEVSSTWDSEQDNGLYVPKRTDRDQSVSCEIGRVPWAAVACNVRAQQYLLEEAKKQNATLDVKDVHPTFANPFHQAFEELITYQGSAKSMDGESLPLEVTYKYSDSKCTVKPRD